MSPVLSRIEALINQLSYQEQWRLLERLVQRLRRSAPILDTPASQHQPALLSNDPSAQAELRETGARLLREAEAQRAQAVRAWDEAMAAMGVSGQPIGAKALRQKMIAEGINPEDGEFSQGIIEMREE
jgi:hypothetical protein